MAAQSGGGCHVRGNIQDQVRQDSEQPDLVGEVSALCEEVGTR